MTLQGKLTLGCIFLISLVASIVIIYSTRWGPWVFSDSTEYIVSARNLIAGHGLGLYGPSGAFHPLNLHPPFYSLLLGFFGWIGLDLVAVARWVNVILFGSTILLVGLSVYAFTHSSWLSILCSILVLSMPALVDIFSGAMSESLFIFTGFTSLILILLFLRNNRRILLLIAGLATGLSMFTRYVGVAFIITGVIGLLVFSARTWKNRIIDVIIFGLVGSLPTIGWLAWLKFQSINVRNVQQVSNFGELLENFRLSVMEIFWSWLPFTSLLPRYSYHLARNTLIIAAALMLVLISLTLWRMRKIGRNINEVTQELSFAGIMILFAMAYMLVLAFSYLYTTPAPDLITRTLIPVQVALIIGFFALCLFFIRAWPSLKWLPVIPILLAVGISISYSHDSLDIVSPYHQYGFGYTSQGWRASSTIEAIEQLPSNITLVSNESAAVLFYTDRPAYDITELTSDKPVLNFARYGDDPTDPGQVAFREQGAALVLFNSDFWQFQRLYGDQTSRRLAAFTQGLRLYAQLGDGAIYFYKADGK